MGGRPGIALQPSLRIVELPAGMKPARIGEKITPDEFRRLRLLEDPALGIMEKAKRVKTQVVRQHAKIARGLISILNEDRFHEQGEWLFCKERLEGILKTLECSPRTQRKIAEQMIQLADRQFESQSGWKAPPHGLPALIARALGTGKSASILVRLASETKSQDMREEALELLVKAARDNQALRTKLVSMPNVMESAGNAGAMDPVKIFGTSLLPSIQKSFGKHLKSWNGEDATRLLAGELDAVHRIMRNSEQHEELRAVARCAEAMAKLARAAADRNETKFFAGLSSRVESFYGDAVQLAYMKGHGLEQVLAQIQKLPRELRQRVLSRSIGIRDPVGIPAEKRTRVFVDLTAECYLTTIGAIAEANAKEKAPEARGFAESRRITAAAA